MINFKPAQSDILYIPPTDPLDLEISIPIFLTYCIALMHGWSVPLYLARVLLVDRAR
jgi:hypothetical protein